MRKIIPIAITFIVIGIFFGYISYSFVISESPHRIVSYTMLENSDFENLYESADIEIETAYRTDLKVPIFSEQGVEFPTNSISNQETIALNNDSLSNSMILNIHTDLNWRSMINSRDYIIQDFGDYFELTPSTSFSKSLLENYGISLTQSQLTGNVTATDVALLEITNPRVIITISKYSYLIESIEMSAEEILTSVMLTGETILELQEYLEQEAINGEITISDFDERFIFMNTSLVESYTQPQIIQLFF